MRWAGVWFVLVAPSCLEVVSLININISQFNKNKSIEIKWDTVTKQESYILNN